MKCLHRTGMAFLVLLCSVLSHTRANEPEGEAYALENPVTVRYLKRNLAKQTPRLVLTPQISRDLKRQVKGDTEIAGFYEILRSEAEAMLALPLLERKMTGRRMSTGDTRVRLSTLGMVAHIEKAPEILERLNREILAVCAFPDWNPSHYLDVAGTALPLAMAIDWAGNDLPASTVEHAKAALIEKGIQPSFRDEPYNWWIDCHHNWNQVCHAGMIAAAIVVAEKDPDLAARTIGRALDKMGLALAAYGPDGVYPEGASYWGYGTSHTIITVAMFRTAFGTDFGITDFPGFMESADFIPKMTAPTGEYYTFYDCGSNLTGERRGYGDASVAMFNRQTVNLLWFARETGNAFLYDASYFSDGSDDRRSSSFDPAALVWLARLETDRNEGFPGVWKGEGPNPLVIFREDEEHMYYLGTKGGKATNNHGNMDAGSFIFELNGVRWSIDPGNQSYHALERTGFDLWNNEQDSERWTLLTKNNFGHSTLTVNDELHAADGMSTLVNLQEGARPRATFDLSAPLEGQLESARRTFIRDGPASMITEDRFELSENTKMITWQLVTTADVQVVEGGALLEQDGRQLKLENLSHPEITVSVMSLDPAPLELDKHIPGLKRLEIRVPAWTLEGKEGLIRVRLSGV